MATKENIAKHRKEVVAILKDAKIAIDKEMSRVETMGDYELAQFKGKIETLPEILNFEEAEGGAMFDANAGCH